MKLKDKVAIVTGGGTGIGRAIALGYAREGAKVVIASRNLSRLEKTVKEIETLGVKALPIKTDITKMAEVESMVKQVIESFGRIDILVNNAGFYPAKSFLDITEKEWMEIVDVNLHGTFRCTQAVVKEMLKRKYGKIINISTSLAIIGFPLLHHYIASKGGIISLTRSLAAEFGPLGINVNSISPGLTLIEATADMYTQEFKDTFSQAMSLKRLGVPEDYVGMAVLLASDESSYLSGVIIPIDGGHSTVFSLAP